MWKKDAMGDSRSKNYLKLSSSINEEKRELGENVEFFSL